MASKIQLWQYHFPFELETKPFLPSHMCPEVGPETGAQTPISYLSPLGCHIKRADLWPMFRFVLFCFNLNLDLHIHTGRLLGCWDSAQASAVSLFVSA